MFCYCSPFELILIILLCFGGFILLYYEYLQFFYFRYILYLNNLLIYFGFYKKYFEMWELIKVFGKKKNTIKVIEMFLSKKKKVIDLHIACPTSRIKLNVYWLWNLVLLDWVWHIWYIPQAGSVIFTSSPHRCRNVM